MCAHVLWNISGKFWRSVALHCFSAQALPPEEMRSSATCTPMRLAPQSPRATKQVSSWPDTSTSPTVLLSGRA